MRREAADLVAGEVEDVDEAAGGAEREELARAARQEQVAPSAFSMVSTGKR